MQIDWYFQLLNPLVFIIFAGGFICVHKMRASRAALVFAASYVVGALAFIIDVLVSDSSDVLIRTGVAGLYAITIILLVCGLWRHYRGPAPWRALVALLGIHLVVYAYMMGIGATWARSIIVNFGCGILLSVGLLAFQGRLARMLDKFLYLIHFASCLVCFLRPIAIALVVDGPITAENHDEGLLLLSLHLVAAVSAVTTGMVLLAILSRAIFEELQASSLTDPLTGLLNRRGFEARAQDLLARRPDQSFTVIMADIDHFKRVNDTYGHGAGDTVIAAMGQLLAREGALQGVVARLGGEEFVILLPGVDLAEGSAFAEALRCRVRDPHLNTVDPELQCTASFGVAERRSAEALDDLIQRADQALYLAKSSGRDCVRAETDLALRELKDLVQSGTANADTNKAVSKETASSGIGES
ncbi:MAG: diguanylate cyclase [Pseudomonadota bacterium]